MELIIEYFPILLPAILGGVAGGLAGSVGCRGGGMAGNRRDWALGLVCAGVGAVLGVAFMALYLVPKEAGEIKEKIAIMKVDLTEKMSTVKVDLIEKMSTEIGAVRDRVSRLEGKNGSALRKEAERRSTLLGIQKDFVRENPWVPLAETAIGTVEWADSTRTRIRIRDIEDRQVQLVVGEKATITTKSSSGWKPASPGDIKLGDKVAIPFQFRPDNSKEAMSIHHFP